MVAFYPKPTRSRVLLHGHIKVRQALGRSCGREGASRFVGTGVDAGASNRPDACSFGPGKPCPRCNRNSWHVDLVPRLPNTPLG